MLEFDVQASPKCLELFGWKKLREIADNFIKENPSMPFYPIEWCSGIGKYKEKADQAIEMGLLLIDGLNIKILQYEDADGINVISFDPNNEVPQDFVFYNS